MTTGRTVAEAREAALDVLGIDESELEFEVLDEPFSALFGLRTVDARIRARVRPTRPRPKLDRRARRPRRRKNGRPGSRDRTPDDDRDDLTSEPEAVEPDRLTDAARSGGGRRRRRRGRGGGKTEETPESGARDTGAASDARSPSDDSAAEPQPAAAGSAQSQSTSEPRQSEAGGTPTMSDIPLTEQEPVAKDFVAGLIEAFGVEAEVTTERIEDDDAVEVQVLGEDLGLLVGPRGATLSSVSELTRTAVAQQLSGRLEGRLRVDIAGYRARRKEALVRFAGQVAAKVLESGNAAALEPMSPPDRKIVHDAVNDIEGVHTTSRGEDQRRHVVIQPDD